MDRHVLQRLLDSHLENLDAGRVSPSECARNLTRLRALAYASGLTPPTRKALVATFPPGMEPTEPALDLAMSEGVPLDFDGTGQDGRIVVGDVRDAILELQAAEEREDDGSADHGE